LSLAEARALCPGVVQADHDSAGDAKALEALGRWMTRFTPVVQCCEMGVLLDVTGTDRLYGSMESLAGRLSRALKALGITAARVAIAPTPGAAWAMTFGDSSAVVVDEDHLLTALAPLPPSAFRLDEGTLVTLHHLGIETVGQLLAIPRDLLPARFGPGLLLRVDQALGCVAEPLAPLPYCPAIEAAMDFDGVVDSLETLQTTFKELIGRVAGQLVRRGLGARRLAVTFLRPYAEPIEKTIDLSSPTRNEAVLFNLIRCAMETVGEAKARKGRKTVHVFSLRRSVAPSLRRYEMYQPAGFTGLRLGVPCFERLSEEQIFLLEQEEHAGRLELDRLVERLHIRLGEEALTVVEAVESYVPERAYRVGGSDRVQSSGFRVQEEQCPRPLHLLLVPREIPVMVRPSDDRDGAPVSFTLDGKLHRIAHAVGPERIAGTWWAGHDKTRDYFDVEDEAGRRWWVFRVTETSKWYLHGTFE
jgi:protein ImuB